jgi:hypothetical protein
MSLDTAMPPMLFDLETLVTEQLEQEWTANSRRPGFRPGPDARDLRDLHPSRGAAVVVGSPRLAVRARLRRRLGPARPHGPPRDR